MGIIGKCSMFSVHSKIFDAVHTAYPDLIILVFEIISCILRFSCNLVGKKCINKRMA